MTSKSGLDIPHYWQDDPTDWRGYSMLGWPGHPDLDNWLNIINDTIPDYGDILICGTARGGDVMALRRYLKDPDRHITVIDSFEGLSEANPQDLGTIKWKKGNFAYPVKQYKEFFRLTNTKLPDEIHKLWITPENLFKVKRRNLALLFVDVDLYEPARACYEYFVPWVMSNGLVLTHDYGFEGTPGVKIAAEEYAPGQWQQVYGSLHRLVR